MFYKREHLARNRFPRYPLFLVNGYTHNLYMFAKCFYYFLSGLVFSLVLHHGPRKNGKPYILPCFGPCAYFR